MTIKEIVDYVLNTPHNTNPAILTAMLERLLNEGDLPTQGEHIIYDGGEEK